MIVYYLRCYLRYLLWLFKYKTIFWNHFFFLIFRRFRFTDKELVHQVMATKRRFRFLSSLLALFGGFYFFILPAPVSHGQEKHFVDNVAARLVDYLDAYRKNQNLTSLSFAMFMGPEYRIEHVVGQSDIGQRIDVTSANAYTLASVSKTITGPVVIDLVNQNLISIDDSVYKYIEGFPKNVTVLELLNHTSGFRRENENEYHLRNSSYAKILKYLPTQLKSKNHRYSNFNYAVLGALVEKVTGQPFSKVASDYYFRITGEPLHFSNQNEPSTNSRFVKNYVRRNSRPYLHQLVDFDIWEPAALAQTSPKALTKFLRYHMNSKFINYLASHAVLTKKFGFRNGRSMKDYYALGFRLRYWGDELLYIYHDGFIYGVVSTLYYLPKKDVGFVAVSNLSMFPRNSITLGGLYREVERVVEEEYNRDIAEYTARNGSLEGVLYYETRQYQSELVESQIDKTAQELLRKKRYEQAINLFEFNNYMFATSGKTYESLGRAYMAGGYVELAVETFKKALTLNPQSENTKRLLRTINLN